MTDDLGTVKVDPAALVWLQWNLDFWQAANTANATRLLHNWCKKYCGEDAPTAHDEPDENSEVEEAEP